MDKKLYLPLLAAAFLVGSSAYAAGTSSATIGYYDTFARGGSVSMKGTVSVDGYNNPISTNKVWVEVYQQNCTACPDTRKFDQSLTAGASFTNYTFNASESLHYLWLDPDGPNYYGVVASGSATN
ncbi:hypothetical protein CIG75_17255 [Tumebacillus algifaecis]|uniref:Uncharacterized protein n=1 Tax=Tumebacillus algifaecis TaxID=1214604 RepID=A0A223D590_9BACL|nr:hypothetical protein [Tumebacillus algifaecis]ASS76534.1 hypothetical protein CIG75_17255 [Tumebacillus algifaecis]